MINREYLLRFINEIADYLSNRGFAGITIRFVGGSAVGIFTDRASYDIDFDYECPEEQSVELAEAISAFLTERNISADFSEDATRWWVVSVRKNRYEPVPVAQVKGITFQAANPLEVLVKKIHRFYDKDIEDALLLIKRFNIGFKDFLKTIHDAVIDSQPSHALYLFKKNAEVFIREFAADLWSVKDIGVLLTELNQVWTESIAEKKRTSVGSGINRPFRMGT